MPQGQCIIIGRKEIMKAYKGEKVKSEYKKVDVKTSIEADKGILKMIDKEIKRNYFENNKQMWKGGDCKWEL